MRACPILCLALLLSPLVGGELSRRPITHEDLWLMRRVGSPAPSPDGRWAVASVTVPAYDSKEQGSDLWLIAVDGSESPRQLTHNKAAESGAAWNPDSSRLAFSAKRDGDEVSQIYVLDIARGGEAERVTSLSTGARSPRWSPDGRRLLFVSEVFPGAKNDADNRREAKARKDRKSSARVHDGFPIKYWDRWLDDRQAHLFVQEAKAGADARDLLAGTELIQQPGFAGREAEAGEELPAEWVPDGASVVFIATINRHRAAFELPRTHLFQVPAAGGEPRQLTTDADNYRDLEFRPDGRAILVTFTRGGDTRTYHHARLASFPWPFDASRRKILPEGFELSVARFAASHDNATIFFTAEAGHRVKLFSVPASGGRVSTHEVASDGCLNGLATAGSRLVALADSARRPPEVVRIEPAAHRLTALTHFNDTRVAALDLAPLEEFTTRSAKGWSIHSYLVRPPGFDPAKKYPLFVMIHGGPAPQFKDQWVLRWNYHLFAARGYVVLLTNYSGSTGYSEAFGQAVQLDPLKGPADEINHAADEAIKRYPFIDGSRQAAGGASYGGHLANWLQATTTRYRCLISHAGLVNLESQWATSDTAYPRELNNGGPVWEQGGVWREQNPVRLAGNHAKRSGWITPVLVTVGELDYRVPANNAYEYWAYLQRLQVPSRLLSFPDENHWIMKGENSRFWYAEVHAWLARWLQ
jgi:dipeptidyl aminopeptidase/acylaminoacyl peptidase